MKIVMICAETTGGHPLYIRELLSALVRRTDDIRVELLAPTGLDDASAMSPIPFMICCLPLRR